MTNAPSPLTTPSRTTAWPARRCSTPRAFRRRASTAGAPKPPTWTPPRETTNRPCARASRPPWLDLALLGLGPDGHTASLFPGTAALAEQRRLAVAVDVPAVGGRRLTLTYPTLLGACAVFFLVAGSDKAAALADVMRRDSTLPAARIVHRAAPVSIFCDRAAARDITSAS